MKKKKRRRPKKNKNYKGDDTAMDKTVVGDGQDSSGVHKENSGKGTVEEDDAMKLSSEELVAAVEAVQL